MMSYRKEEDTRKKREISDYVIGSFIIVILILVGVLGTMACMEIAGMIEDNYQEEPDLISTVEILSIRILDTTSDKPTIYFQVNDTESHDVFIITSGYRFYDNKSYYYLSLFIQEGDIVQVTLEYVEESPYYLDDVYCIKELVILPS